MARISEDVKAAVLADLRETRGTPEGSQRLIAERHGISGTTVRRIAEAAGESVTDHTRTKNAVATMVLTNAQRRERLAARMLDVAERALDDMTSRAVIYNFGGKDNTYAEREVDRPPTGDQRNLMIIAGTAVDKHAVLEHFDSAGAAGQQADLLLRLLTGQQGA